MWLSFLSTTFVQNNFHSDKYTASFSYFCMTCMQKHTLVVLRHCQILTETEIYWHILENSQISNLMWIHLAVLDLLHADKQLNNMAKLILSAFPQVSVLNIARRINTVVHVLSFQIFMPYNNYKLGMRIMYFNHFRILRVLMTMSIFTDIINSHYIEAALYIGALVV
jgi:hypothetical protein